MVTAGEVQYAVENLAVNSLLDLRRRTRIGMGTCQEAVRLPGGRASATV